MSKIDDGGAAFPGTQYASGISPSGHSVGMSLRDYFAAKAMQAEIARSTYGIEDAPRDIAECAYEYADAMLSAHKSREPEQQHPTGWIEWNGGECPVPKGSKFWIKFRDGHACDAGTGEGLTWHHECTSADIIAYFIYNNGD